MGVHQQTGTISKGGRQTMNLNKLYDMVESDVLWIKIKQKREGDGGFY